MLPRVPAESAGFSSSYTLGRKLGEGSFGTVYKATRIGTGGGGGGGGGARSSWVGRESPAAAAASFFAVKCIKKANLDETGTDEVISEVRLSFLYMYVLLCMCFVCVYFGTSI